MKKTVFTMLLAMLCLGVLRANPVDVDRAKALGVKFMNTNTEIKSLAADLAYTAFADDGQPAFYVFAMQPKGFVIVSADDRAMPILGYSTEGAFSDELPEGLESFFRNYRAGFSQMMANDDPRTDEAISDWERLAATGKVNNARITREVPQMLTCIWNQSALYNDMCPVDSLGPNNHVYAGCVATAMAQIMYYWKWPQMGSEMHTYEIWQYGSISANFGGTHYRFDLMPDFLDWTSKPEEIRAVAQLQFHAGVSVDMGYSPDGSGAYSQYVPDALERYFRYDGGMMQIDYRDWHMNADWDNMLRDNLDLGMPLYYSASGPDGGHAFVCDGYDDNNMFHFNWGWQGLDNGYYLISGFYLSHYSFPDGHAAVFGIYPNDEYCLRPTSVSDVQIEPVATGTNRVSFTAPSMTLCEFDLDQIDSILILRNNEVIHRELNVEGGAQVTFEDHDALGICHYAIVPWAYEYIGEDVRDTIMNGPTCELTFHLHDSVGDGWIAKSISIVDSRGIAIMRLGLAEGDDATVTVEVPAESELALHWAYSIGGKDNESYFEVFNWKDDLIYATEGRPHVGELCRFYTDCIDAVGEAEEIAMTLYPNPVSSMLTIEGVEVELVEVLNAMGQTLGTYRHNEIDLSGLQSGVYFLRVTSTEGQVSTEKIIKK